MAAADGQIKKKKLLLKNVQLVSFFGPFTFPLLAKWTAHQFLLSWPVHHVHHLLTSNVGQGSSSTGRMPLTHFGLPRASRSPVVIIIIELGRRLQAQVTMSSDGDSVHKEKEANEK